MEEKNLSDFLPNKDAVFYKEYKKTDFEKQVTEDEIISQIKMVMDPEIPVNLYDLGLIYNINIDSKNNVLIEMTLTNPNCPVAGSMPKNVGLAVEKIANLSSVKVTLVWQPQWNKNMMSEDAKLALDIY